MIRANTEQAKFVPWFAKAGAACSIVPIARFVSDHIFALKGGGYGCLFALSGMDEEGLTDQELESHLRMIEGALRGLPEGACLYQYTRVRSGFDLPRKQLYENPVTHSFVTDRVEFLEKTASFRRIDLHWCLTLEPSKVKAFERRPAENAAATSRMLAELNKTAALLAGNLSSSIGLLLLDRQSVFQFFSYLFNLEDWAEWGQLREDIYIDRQIVQNPVAWKSDHLRIGRRFVQMYSLKTTPEASRPCLLADLQKLDCDSILCSTWRPKSTATARHEIDQQEKFISFFKVGVLSRVMAGKDTASLDTGAGAKAANNAVDDLSEVIRSLDKKAQGEYSLRLLVAARSVTALHSISPAVHRVFVEARAQVMEETLGNLSAFYAMFPGNGRFNVFPMWLGEDHHARLSSIFAPSLGHRHSEDLDNEYLNIFETRTGTPFFQDGYVDGVRVQLILGPTGSGKTTVLRSIREGAEKSGYAVEGFAPTSRAAAQLREAGIEASTLQSFLARRTESAGTEPAKRHLYMLDESSLASTKQMRDFLQKLTPNDRVLVIGDIAQHQGVDAGRPFQQMQEAGMRTAELDRIMRQRDPELLKAVEHLAKNETREGIALLRQQGRITEVSNRQERIEAIAKDYAARPGNTIVVSPDNKSRQEINEAVRAELLRAGKLQNDGQAFRTLSHRSDMTGADRTWAARYNIGDVLQYNTGSKDLGIERNSFATVQAVDARANLLTVQRADGEIIAYDPRRLRGVNVFREQEREFASGDRLQFVASLKELGVANRDLGTIQHIEGRSMTVRMDGKDKRRITFDTQEVRQFDHGYAVTSHSSQGLTAERVLAHFDTEGPRGLVNQRLAYVAISRASDDAHIYTNDAARLGKRLATDVSKTAAIDLSQSPSKTEIERAVASFRSNDPATATTILQHDGRVHEYASAEHRLAAVALAYASRHDRAVVVAPDVAERKELTSLIRDELRQQGRLSPESHSLPIWVGQHLGNPRLATSYLAGDHILYTAGSAKHGILENSTATVLAVDAKANRLTVAMRDGNETSYNPALSRTLALQSQVFREEMREVSKGERIRFMTTALEVPLRRGDFATVEHIGEDRSLTVRSDRGKSAVLPEELARHIDYGYAADRMPPRGVDRVFVSGEAAKIANMQEDFARISGQTRDLAIYTSEAQDLAQGRAIKGLEVNTPEMNIQDAVLMTEIAVEGFSRGR